MPSKNDNTGGFCMAKASARPITMQLVMIRPTNTDSCLERLKAKALSTLSTTITREAMITICTIIRMELGIWLRIIEINRLENPVTRVRAIDITSAVFRFEVTARAEQIPRICKPIGLLLKIGLSRTSLIVGCDMIKPPLFADWRGTGRSRSLPARSAASYSHHCWSGLHPPGHQPGESPARSAHRRYP